MYSSDFKIPFSRPDVPQALREAGYTPLLAALLGLRGITRPEDAERFLRGGAELLRDPLEMLDMDKAADRLRREVLYYVAISAPVGPQVQAVQRTFQLAGLIT